MHDPAALRAMVAIPLGIIACAALAMLMHWLDRKDDR